MFIFMNFKNMIKLLLMINLLLPTDTTSCAIFAHPDDELNILPLLSKTKFNIFYLTKGEMGYRYSDYYGDTNHTKKNIVEIRERETELLSKRFNFNYEMYNLPDIPNDAADKRHWDSLEVDDIHKNIISKYDTIYVIGVLKREHHQHTQIANNLSNVTDKVIIHCNWYFNKDLTSIKKEITEMGGYNINTHKYSKDDLRDFIDTLKSQGTMSGAIDCDGIITYQVKKEFAY